VSLAGTKEDGARERKAPRIRVCTSGSWQTLASAERTTRATNSLTANIFATEKEEERNLSGERQRTEARLSSSSRSMTAATVQQKQRRQ
jgi:hypothetical protein